MVLSLVSGTESVSTRSIVAWTRFPGSGCVEAHSGMSPAPSSLLTRCRVWNIVAMARGIVAVADHVLEAELVGLALRVTPIAEEECTPGAGQSGVLGDVGRDDAAHAEADLGDLLARHLLHEWRAVTWPISWPSTPTSSASLFMW